LVDIKICFIFVVSLNETATRTKVINKLNFSIMNDFVLLVYLAVFTAVSFFTYVISIFI